MDIRRKRQLEVANYLLNKYTKDILSIDNINDFIEEVWEEMSFMDSLEFITEEEIDEIKSFISGS